MLDSLHHFLHDHLFMVCLVTIPVGVYSAYRCFNALSASTDDAVAPGVRPTRRMQQRPGTAPPAPKPLSPTKPVQQQFISDKPSPPASTEAGIESRHHKAVVSTIRIDSGDVRHSTASDAIVTKPTDNQDSKATVADEVNQLFAGLDDRLQPSSETRDKLTPEQRSADALLKAGRLEELGFHHHTQRDDKTPRPVTNNPSKPTESAQGPELDDILAKLDKVLAEKPVTPPATPAPAAPAPATPPIVKTPLWARADVSDEDVDAKPEPGKQLGLFEEGKDKPAK